MFALLLSPFLTGCEAGCPSTGECAPIEEYVPPDVVYGEDCGELFARGCDLDADLTTVFDPLGYGSVHGLGFWQNSHNFGRWLHVADEAFARPGLIELVLPGTAAYVYFEALVCLDSCSLLGIDGTITATGAISSCASDEQPDCLEGNVAIDFAGVVFDDGSMLDGSGWMAEYQ